MERTVARVASGHAETTRAAAEVLRDGGNAVDALIAAVWTACVVEPVFCSPGGGGHALLRMRRRAPVVLDCFVQTPRVRRGADIDFYPIHGNFGTTQQEFHVGMGSVAVPGLVAGLEALHRRHATRPMRELAAHAIGQARAGWTLNAVQVEAMQILEPIVRATAEAAHMFGLESQHAALPQVGQRVDNPALGDAIEALAAEGSESFRSGHIASVIARESINGGGHITLDDLARYRVRWRRPLHWALGRNVRIWSNPPPAFGGIMVALMTRALERCLPPDAGFGSAAHLDALVAAMQASEQQRLALEASENTVDRRALKQAFESVASPSLQVSRGTTHISVRDAEGNFAGMTISNGEGCGRVVPGMGFMLNNMLGEQDLNRAGFGQWPTGQRMSSMMAPTLIEHQGNRILLGSGGSNRIRTAIAQVLCNLMHFDMPLEQAIRAPRLHLEFGELAIETGPDAWPAPAMSWLEQTYPSATRWPKASLYFGGTHAAADNAQAADPRRLGTSW
ncbi:MAG: gamma-glutamyltransferase, partial [Wenzhouxiangellaceae bacterium]